MCYICLSKIAGKAKDITHSSITFDKHNRIFQTLKKTRCGLQKKDIGQNQNIVKKTCLVLYLKVYFLWTFTEMLLTVWA